MEINQVSLLLLNNNTGQRLCKAGKSLLLLVFEITCEFCSKTSGKNPQNKQFDGVTYMLRTMKPLFLNNETQMPNEEQWDQLILTNTLIEVTDGLSSLCCKTKS